MSKDPAHRYATAEELRADLVRFNEGRSPMAMNDPTSVLAAATGAGAAATEVVGAVDGRDATRAMAATEPEAEADDEGPNRTRTYAVVLALLIILLLVAGYFLGRNLGYFGGAPSFDLPSVVGQPVAAATTKLQADGLKVATVDQQSTDAAGTVISTNPAPNSLVQKGSTVTLRVAKAPPVPKVAVPSGITNTSQTNAESILRAAGLTATIVNKTNDAQAGTVLSANPPPGSNVPQGSSVTLTVSSGPANVPVPSVAGLSQTAAANLLGQSQLTYGGVSDQYSSQYSAGLVITSSPGPGALVPPGSAVTLIVSTGSPPTTTTTTSTSTTTTTSPSSSSTPTTNGNGGGGGGGGGGNHSRRAGGF